MSVKIDFNYYFPDSLLVLFSPYMFIHGLTSAYIESCQSCLVYIGVGGMKVWLIAKICH